MPSPVKSYRGKKRYRRGTKGKGKNKKVRYSYHNKRLDAKRRARKGTRKQVKRYPQAYD